MTSLILCLRLQKQRRPKVLSIFGRPTRARKTIYHSAYNPQPSLFRILYTVMEKIHYGIGNFKKNIVVFNDVYVRQF